MREIILDTETTGLTTDDRVVEIGAVEIKDLMPTGREFHVYINPQMEVPKEAFAIHGLSYDFLKKHPTFKRVVNRFLKFIGDAQLVAHNASFDVRMLNGELQRLQFPPLTNPVVDSLALSRKVKPGGAHSLDALISHYRIKGGQRDLHGALLDAKLLSEVYIELRGGRQHAMDLYVEKKVEEVASTLQRPRKLASRLSQEEIERHKAFVLTELGVDSPWAEHYGLQPENLLLAG